MVSRLLGVECNYCHVQEGRGGRTDMAADDKATKKAARGMMLLAREITESTGIVGKAPRGDDRVGCATCHRGVPIPKQITDVVTDAASAGGRRRAWPNTASCARSSTAGRATTSARTASGHRAARHRRQQAGRWHPP